MPSRNKRPSVNPSNGSARAEANGSQLFRGEQHDQDERIIMRRADMLRCRQVDLDGLMVNHDNLVCLPIWIKDQSPFPHGLCTCQVREAFQLDKFVTLLSYDPRARVILVHLMFVRH